MFKQVGGFLDPRTGRGAYPSFPADFGVVGWPLDQMFVSPGFTFRSLRIPEDAGSDHRPLAAELCLTPGARRSRMPTPTSSPRQPATPRAP
nr:hypothetical protein [Sphingomonas japonica]